MKFILKSATLCAIMAGGAMMVSCNEDSNIGSSLVDVNGSITITDKFTVEGSSVPIGAVQSRTVMQLIGNIDAKGYGKFNADFVTQFMPAMTLDSLLTSDSQIDGLRLVMMYRNGQFVGDSIVPMGLEVYRLDKKLTAPIYSDVNPDQFYNPADMLGSRSYTASNLELSDSLAKLSYREIFVDLPKSLALELYDMYRQNPATYADPTLFNDKFKGIYVKSSFGSGRVTKLGATALQMLWHYDTKNAAGRDTTYNYIGTYYAVSPEIVTNNNIGYVMAPELQQRIDRGENLLVAPAGQEIELTFPIEDIMHYYRTNKSKLTVLNDLTFSVPAERIANNYGINPPQYALMVLKNKKKEFFEKSQVTDNVTSFYAKYDVTTGQYDFGSMRRYMIDMLAKESLTPDDYTFTITPVSVTLETVGNSYYGNQTNIVTAIAPYVEQPAMVKINLDKSKIILTFSKQNSKN